MLTVETITSDRQFEHIRDQWSELLANSDSNTVFLTWEWMHTWWRHVAHRRQLFIVTVRDGGEVIAIAPFVLRRPDLARLLPSRSLEFLAAGIVGSDYLDIIIRRGWEGSALAHLADWLSHRKLVLSLAQVATSSMVFRLAQYLENRQWRTTGEKINVCPFIDLSNHSWQSYLESLSANHRYSFRRQLRNMRNRFRFAFERVTSEDRREQALAHVWELHNRRWESRGGSDGFTGARMLAFHREFTRLAAQRGWLRLFLLSLDERPAAALYGFMYHGKFSYYQAGFDPVFAKMSVGSAMLGLVIESCIDEGASEFDMLHGDESYKFRWTGTTRDLARVELYPPNGLGLLCHRGVNLSRASRRMARTLLPNGIRVRLAGALHAETRKGTLSAGTD